MPDVSAACPDEVIRRVVLVLYRPYGRPTGEEVKTMVDFMRVCRRFMKIGLAIFQNKVWVQNPHKLQAWMKTSKTGCPLYHIGIGPFRETPPKSTAVWDNSVTTQMKMIFANANCLNMVSLDCLFLDQSFSHWIQNLHRPITLNLSSCLIDDGFLDLVSQPLKISKLNLWRNLTEMGGMDWKERIHPRFLSCCGPHLEEATLDINFSILLRPESPWNLNIALPNSLRSLTVLCPKENWPKNQRSVMLMAEKLVEMIQTAGALELIDWEGYFPEIFTSYNAKILLGKFRGPWGLLQNIESDAGIPEVNLTTPLLKEHGEYPLQLDEVQKLEVVVPGTRGSGQDTAVILGMIPKLQELTIIWLDSELLVRGFV